MGTTEKPGYWAVIPAQVRYDPELPPNAKLMYAEISSLTDSAGYCWASNAYFAGLYGCTERTVQNLLRALHVRGYIRIQDGTGGPQRRKIFAGINPVGDNHENNFVVTTKKFSGPPENNFVENNKINNKANRTPKAPKGAEGGIWDPEAFEAFWALYPKKKDKQKAIKEWNRLKADRKLMRVMSAALKTQMASEEWQRDNGRAIPYPCRWISHRRWEDEPESAAQSTAPVREEADAWLL